MNGNFNERQGLKDNDQTVDARGWLEWDPDDASADLAITVSQDGYDCPAPPITCRPPSREWRVEATRPAPPPWQRGPASGTATAVVKRHDGSTYEVPWHSPPLTLG